MNAEPNYIFPLDASGNYFNLQWGLDQSSDIDLDAQEAWAITQGSTNFRIGIIDTGIDADHPDLAGNIDLVNSRNFRPDGFPEDIQDTACHSHGTHVAGIIGALRSNGIGVSGVIPRVKLVVLRACLGGTGCYADSIIASSTQ